VVHGDDYFEPHNDAITWGDFNEVRFDADVLSRVRAGDRAIALRPFDFPNGRIGAEQSLTITRGLMVERWLGLSLDAPWDITIWIDTPAEICLERGLMRDGAVARLVGVGNGLAATGGALHPCVGSHGCR